MKISILGPTNLNKFSKITGKSSEEIENIAKSIGKIIAENNHDLVVVFGYAGMLKLVGDSYKENNGKLEMLYTENDYDWETKIYMKYLEEADIKTKKESWHDMLLSLVKDSDLVICAGLSAGVFAELGYMEWNHQENKGNVKKLIGIKELLKNEEFPPEISLDMNNIIISSINDLDKVIKEVGKQ
ncbi:hypothetical protein K8R62_03270 [bacterium]|nr:hypothetical protein [bacterium]